jgi:hypothetical protein
MFNILCEDLLLLLLLNLTNINDIINFSATNNSIYQLINNNIYIEWGKQMYSTEFWIRANKRTITISKPCINMKMELLRLQCFTDLQNKYGHEKWTKEDYYKYWTTMEKVMAEKSLKIC